ncbi:hypothetical protein AFLA_013664 [Aspergillus flavus NRRL3357]|nr:hypothetical protein AFLA_013664 [Aspergillus flavus NRRL3357]
MASRLNRLHLSVRCVLHAATSARLCRSSDAFQVDQVRSAITAYITVIEVANGRRQTISRIISKALKDMSGLRAKKGWWYKANRQGSCPQVQSYTPGILANATLYLNTG